MNVFHSGRCSYIDVCLNGTKLRFRNIAELVNIFIRDDKDILTAQFEDRRFELQSDQFSTAFKNKEAVDLLVACLNIYSGIDEELISGEQSVLWSQNRGSNQGISRYISTPQQ